MGKSEMKTSRKNSKAVRPGSPTSSALWLKIASTPAYCDVVAMSTRRSARSRGWDLDPLEPPTW